MKNSETKKTIPGGVDKQVTFREKEWYREKIVDMINHIDNENYLLKIYSFVKVFFED